MKRLIVVLLTVMIPALTFADTIYLKNGRQIKTDETWEESGQIKCYRFGNVVGYPLDQVERIEKPVPQAERSQKPADPHTAGTPGKEEAISELALSYKMACDALESLRESIDNNIPLPPAQTKAMTQKWTDCTTVFSKYFPGKKLSASESAKVRKLERQSKTDIRRGKSIAKTFPAQSSIYMMKGMYSAGKIMKITWDNIIRREKLGIDIVRLQGFKTAHKTEKIPSDCYGLSIIYLGIALDSHRGISQDEAIEKLQQKYGLEYSLAYGVVTPVYEFKDVLSPSQITDKMFEMCREQKKAKR